MNQRQCPSRFALEAAGKAQPARTPFAVANRALLTLKRHPCVKTLALTLICVVTVQGENRIDFNRDIRPILSNNCFKCHGPDEAKREVELRLDTREAAVADRGGYHAVDPQNPSASALLERINSASDAERMPPPDSGLRIADKQKLLLRQWIEQGAVFDEHWAFRPLRQPSTPKIDSPWPRNEIDAFVLDELTHHNLAPSPEAAPHKLIRRVYLDVLGLLPTPGEVHAFVDDKSPDAYGRMVDRALASPHYGERWGRHWLDQARYADTNGYSVDAERSMWPYRDWVIQALNDDKPFDQFTIEQLAGDLLPNASTEQLIATGFHRNTLINEEGGTDVEQFRVEAVVDRVNTTGAVWLGLTVGCAQCHTHKFDPITHDEYYQLFAFFNNCEDENSRPPTLPVPTSAQQERLDELDAKIRAVASLLEKNKAEQAPDAANAAEAAGTPQEVPTDDTAKASDELAALKKERDQFLEAIPQTMILRERTTPRETHVLIRGDFLRKGKQVFPDTPAALPPISAAAEPRTRLDLARWLVSPQNPLTARVTVNRVWARYFGRGIVETENDFGLQGSAPTHPELLDWLAAEFIDQGWSFKRLHRLILNSATYRQSSHHRQELAEADPLNKLLGRQARLRVEAEIVRDLGLSASGLLHTKIGGPSVYPPQPDGVFSFTQFARQWPTSTGADRYRRGMYTFFIRSAPYPMLTTFDTPVFNVTCTFRQRSNTPLQSLTMANDQTMIEVARALGQRIREQSDNDRDRIEFAVQLCLSRTADSFELDRLASYLEQQRQDFARTPEDAKDVAGDTPLEPIEDAAAWTALARVLLNLDEFITRE
jgi:hypothetical protein